MDRRQLSRLELVGEDHEVPSSPTRRRWDQKAFIAFRVGDTPDCLGDGFRSRTVRLADYSCDGHPHFFIANAYVREVQHSNKINPGRSHYIRKSFRVWEALQPVLGEVFLASGVLSE